ncbi:MAG: hypothetical protein H8E37_13920 [Planctomycetes bacterium]|nr:hypothetical protein [Planctomycetota bacterium]
MSTPLDQLQRVFPVRQLLRGKALRACLWSIIGTVAFTGLVLVSFLVVALLDTRGEASVSASEAEQFGKLIGSEAYGLAGSQPNRRDFTPENIGLYAVAWELRDRPLGGLTANMTRRFTILQQRDSALFYLISVGLLLGLIHSAVMAHDIRRALMVTGHTIGKVRVSVPRHARRSCISDLTVPM